MGKRDHLKDYVPTEDGGYEYVGTHWRWPSAEIRAAFIKDARMVYGVAVACLVVAGCVPAPGTFGAFYVVLPFLIGTVGVVLGGVALFRLLSEADPMRDHIYAANATSLSPKLLVGEAGAVVCAAAALIHGIVLTAMASPEASLPFSFLFAGLMFGSAVCLWRIHTDFSKIIFTRE